jgi:hypothetical protein
MLVDEQADTGPDELMGLIREIEHIEVQLDELQERRKDLLRMVSEHEDRLFPHREPDESHTSTHITSLEGHRAASIPDYAGHSMVH